MKTNDHRLKEEMVEVVLKQCSPDSIYSKKSGDSKRYGLYLVMYGIFISIIFTIFFLYCFLVEYRLVKISKRMNDFDKQHKEIELKLNILTLKNAQVEKSLHNWQHLKAQGK